MAKRLTTLRLEEDVIVNARIFCLKNKKTFTEYVEDLIKKDLEKKGE